MTTVLRILTYHGIPIWRNVQFIQWVSQIASGVLVVVLVSWFLANIGNAIQERDIPYGFSFLSRQYQTPIGQHFLPYQSSNSFLYAFFVAATNTIVVSIVGVVLATALGILVGISRMSGNWILAKAALVNARSHTIDTGVDVIKDDDGTTTLRTLTPSESGGVVTVAVS